MKRNKYNSAWENDFYWLKPSRVSEYYALCVFCKQYFKIDGFGRSQVVGHSKSLKHQELEKARSLDNLNSSNSSQSKLDDSSNVKLSKDEEVINAEIVWTLKTVESTFSFDGLTNYGPLFQSMFYDSIVAKSLDLSKTKIKYLAQFGLVPYVEKLIKADVQGSPFSLVLDETSHQGRRQCDAYLQYWSNSNDKFVRASYCGSIFIGYRKGDHLKEFFFDLVKKFNLDCSLLMHVSANMRISKILNKDLDDLYLTSLFDLSSCIQPIYAAFGTGLTHISFSYMEFLNDLLFFFKFLGFKREEDKVLENLSETIWKFFLESTYFKLLTFRQVLLKVTEHHNLIKDYFTQYLPKQDYFKKEIENLIKYKHMVKTLNDRRTIIYINFITNIANIFEPLLLELTKEDPLIHTLYDGLTKLLFDLMSNFLKRNVISKSGRKLEGDVLMRIDVRNANFHLPNIFLTNKRNPNLPFNSKMAAEIDKEFLQFLVECCSYLQLKLPLNSQFLKDIVHVHPLKKDFDAIARISKTVINIIMNESALNRLFHTQGKDKNSLFELICSQVKLFMLEKDLAFDNIISYWKRIGQLKDGSGEKKYLQLYVVIKCIMVLNHGNFASEKGAAINRVIFNRNGNNLDEGSVYTIRLIQDFLSKLGGVEYFKSDKDVIRIVKLSQKKYNDYLAKKPCGLKKVSIRRCK